MKNLCAVEGCEQEGEAWRCLGDGTFHHHGRIHYDCDRVAASNHGLIFRADDWYLMCAQHQFHIRKAMRAQGLLPWNED